MLGWRIALLCAIALLLASGTLWLLKPQGRRGRVAVAAVREAGVVLGLFAFWQLAGTLAHHNAAGAVGRGRCTRRRSTVTVMRTSWAIVTGACASSSSS